MPRKKPIAIEVTEVAGRRYIVSTFEDGTEQREPVVEKKPTRRPMRPFQRVLIDHTKKKRF